tara:strand:- start:10549 stop:10947 length:399 start_codon:yes stop_codon:yes gene_type:complete
MKCLRKIALLLPLVIVTNIHGKDLVDAIHIVETGGRVGPILGDNGYALGPLQIHRACWKDANVDGDYSQCANLEYSKRVFYAYMKRYATEKRLGRKPTNEDMARIWNGGPMGYKKSSTVKYWAKVKKELNCD